MTLYDPKALEFDEASHTYKLDGRPVPGVTKVIEGEHDFRFVDPATLEAAAVFGRKVHRTIELFELGRLNRATLDPVLNACLIQWESAKAFFKFTVLATEQKLYSRRWKYAGTMDLLVLQEPSLPGDNLLQLILDIKTGGKYPAHKLQSAGYKIAAEELGLVQSDCKRACIYIDEESHSLEWHNDKIDEPAFLSSVSLHYWRIRNGKK